jgi:hypothetical protein
VRIRSAAIFAVLLIAPACSEQSSQPIAEVAVASHDLVVADLDKLVVPSTEIGGLPQGLRVIPDSGWKTNAAEAVSSIDPSDSAQSLAGAGRLKGYELVYSDPTEVALRSGQGTLSVMTWVELFRSEEDASAFLKAGDKRSRKFSGTSPRTGIRFGTVSSFDVRVADEAHGLLEDVTFGAERLHRTLVSFRRGRVLAGSIYVRADGQDVSSDALRLAGVLDARIQHALMGGPDGEAVPIPTDGVPLEDGRPPTQQAPTGAPDLAAIGLSTTDLPPGSAGDTGEYTYANPPRFKFRRNFVLGGASVGGSRIVQVVSEVGAFESATAAAGSLTLTVHGMASPGATKNFATNLAATSGLQATNVRSRQVRLPRGAVGFVTTFDTDLGKLVDFYAIAQQGRGTTSIEAFAVAQDFRYQDLVPLLARAETRLGELR